MNPLPFAPDTRIPLPPDSPDSMDDHEAALYARILADARREDSALENLYLQTLHLAFPRVDEARGRRETEAYARRLEGWSRSLDENGNPCWISLTLPERRDDQALRPEGVLPSESESAAPANRLRGNANDGGEKNALFRAVDRLFTPFTGSKAAVTAKPGGAKGTLVPPIEPHPLRGFIRMLLLGAALALAFHFFLQKG